MIQSSSNFAYAKTAKLSHAKLWSDWIIRIRIRAEIICRRFQWWAHKIFCETYKCTLFLHSYSFYPGLLGLNGTVVVNIIWSWSLSLSCDVTCLQCKLFLRCKNSFLGANLYVAQSLAQPSILLNFIRPHLLLHFLSKFDLWLILKHFLILTN